jgi:hypothetical protein
VESRVPQNFASSASRSLCLLPHNHQGRFFSSPIHLVFPVLIQHQVSALQSFDTCTLVLHPIRRRKSCPDAASRQLKSAVMLPPGGVRKGVASCGGPLRICTWPLPYHIHSRRKTFCSNQLVPSRWQHTARNGHTSTQSLIQPISLQRRNLRANSSLARAKVVARKGHTPHQPVSKPAISGTTGVGDDAQSILLANSPRASELSKEIARLGKLQSDYYDALSRHRQSDVLWLTWEERREVPSSSVNGWITRPQGSRNPKRYGISLQNVFVPQVLGCISDINVRKKIVSWEQDTCKDLAPLFKEMVMSRAKVARLAGFKSYFDYRSQKKMMDTRSVELFLKNLKSQIAPQTDAFMESALEQKMQALDYDFTIKKLRSKLRPGKTIRDYQLHEPEAQINRGDLACTCSRFDHI